MKHIPRPSVGLRILVVASTGFLVSCALFEQLLGGAGQLCRHERYIVSTSNVGENPDRLCDRSGECATLRAALNTANFCRGTGAKRVRLRPQGTYSITEPDVPHSAVRTLSRRAEQRLGPVGLPRIFGTLIIEGEGATIERWANAPEFRLLHVAEGGSLTLQNLTLASGAARRGDGEPAEFGYGGAIYNQGTLDVDTATFTGNGVLWADRGTAGGAIYNASGAQARVVAATFSENVGRSGAIENAGEGELEVLQSTFVRNRGTAAGGIYALGTSGFGGDTYIRSSTFHANQGSAVACSGEAAWLRLNDVTIYANEASGVRASRCDEIRISNTIIAGNAPDCTISYTDVEPEGQVLASDRTCLFASRRASNPRLGALADNGGPTWTHLPDSRSPLVNAGGTECRSHDQRGEPRPSGECDIGAVERQSGDRP